MVTNNTDKVSKVDDYKHFQPSIIW